MIDGLMIYSVDVKSQNTDPISQNPNVHGDAF